MIKLSPATSATKKSPGAATSLWWPTNTQRREKMAAFSSAKTSGETKNFCGNVFSSGANVSVVFRNAAVVLGGAEGISLFWRRPRTGQRRKQSGGEGR
jgi:hypothetical protein